jgi:hypothetical protein
MALFGRQASCVRVRSQLNMLGGGDMPKKMRIVRSTDPDFMELLESGRLVSGADVEAEMAKIKGENHPRSDDEVVQPKNQRKNTNDLG